MKTKYGNCKLCDNPFVKQIHNQEYCCNNCCNNANNIKYLLQKERGFYFNLIKVIHDNWLDDKWTLLDHSATVIKMSQYGFLEFFQDSLYAKLSSKFYEMYGEYL